MFLWGFFFFFFNMSQKRGSVEYLFLNNVTSQSKADWAICLVFFLYILQSMGWIVTLNQLEFFVWLEKMVIFELGVSTSILTSMK